MVGMYFLSTVEARLPAGFRFQPRDDELVVCYLKRFVDGEVCEGYPVLVNVEINKCEPWELPDEARVGNDWYFYVHLTLRYARGTRKDRGTKNGYYKSTGKDRPVMAVVGGRLRKVGLRKTLVFYQGRAPNGHKTDWVMHEYRLSEDGLQQHRENYQSSSSFTQSWVLCRLFNKRKYPDQTGTSEEADSADNQENSIITYPPHAPCFSDEDANNLPYRPFDDLEPFISSFETKNDDGDSWMNYLEHAPETTTAFKAETKAARPPDPLEEFSGVNQADDVLFSGHSSFRAGF